MVVYITTDRGFYLVGSEIKLLVNDLCCFIFSLCWECDSNWLCEFIIVLCLCTFLHELFFVSCFLIGGFIKKVWRNKGILELRTWRFGHSIEFFCFL